MVKDQPLSAEQLALIPQVRADWLKIGLDTAPVDRASVREILGCLYANASKPAPPQIIHLESPMQIALAVSKIFLQGRRVSENLSRQVHWRVFGKFADPLRQQFAEHAVAQVPAPVLDFKGEALVQEQINARIQGVRVWPTSSSFGQFNAWLSWFDFIGRLGIGVARLVPAFDLARACGWSVLFWDRAFISAKPKYIKRDEQGRLHCETGAAVRYFDSFSVFAIHGVRVPEKVVVAPKLITLREIETEQNAEVRRVMIGRYGPERYLLDSRAEAVHRDDFGVLYRKFIPNDEPLVMVKVVNSTPEADGSFKDYFLRVPPAMERARQAVAWTFGKMENEYEPAVQT